MTQDDKLKISQAQKKKAIQSLSFLEKLFVNYQGVSFEQMKELVVNAEITKSPTVSSDFSLPDLGKEYNYYAFSDGS